MSRCQPLQPIARHGNQREHRAGDQRHEHGGPRQHPQRPTDVLADLLMPPPAACRPEHPIPPQIDHRLCRLLIGSAYLKRNKTERTEHRYPVRKSRDYPFIEMAAIGENFAGVLSLGRRKFESSGFARFKAGDTLFAKITPCPENGKIAFVATLPAEFGLGSTEFIMLSPKPNFVSKSAVFGTSRRPTAQRSAGGAGQGPHEAKALPCTRFPSALRGLRTLAWRRPLPNALAAAQRPRKNLRRTEIKL